MYQLHDLLLRYWHYDSFRPLQEEIIQSALDGHDTLALLPTGGGKSLCFQLPALAMPGICVVVSPLISLIKDQVQHLKERGIKAHYLVSGMTSQQRELVLNQCVYGDVKFLYVSPERLRNGTFLEHYRTMKVNLLVVDEAHCISQWGYDFRPSYLNIVSLRPYHSEVPIMALTATATPRVTKDIQQCLAFRCQQCFQSSFARPNLAYMVLREDDKRGRLIRIIRRVGGSGIVYVRNRRRTEDTASMLRKEGISAVAYHAGLESTIRDQRQQQWMKGTAQIIVATNAFGMGIDKGDVRFVVHLDIPTSPEAYFQEAGRCGRDGNIAYAVLLYNDTDLSNLQHSVALSYPPDSFIRNVYNAVCNYYHIPVGSGADLRFELKLEDICRCYHFHPAAAYTALRFLEKEGLLTIPADRGDNISQLYFRATRETLYRYQVAHPRHDALLQALLRQYGGLFSDFTEIYEETIARKLMIPEQEVIQMLTQMNHLELLCYRPKIYGPQICFSADRIPDNSFSLAAAGYNQQLQHAEERADAMYHYVLNNESCRSRQLLSYFGEEGSADCDRCDVCVHKHRNNKEEISSANNTEQRRPEGQKQGCMDVVSSIKNALKKYPRTIKELADDIPTLSESSLIHGVQSLLDADEIKENPVDKRFSLRNCDVRIKDITSPQ